MEYLTFGEQVKIILSRKDMTIKELAERIEAHTGMKMSRQNLTQRLGRDNFQEQDMRMIASILDCPFQLSILGGDTISQAAAEAVLKRKNEEIEREKDEPDLEEMQMELPLEEMQAGAEVSGEDCIDEEMTLGELYAVHDEQMGEELNEAADKGILEETSGDWTADKEESGEADRIGKTSEAEPFDPVIRPDDVREDLQKGEINPYTGHEYQSNSVRMHPSRIGYVQVYDRKLHKWTEMTEWAFLGYQERKKALLGRDYDPPIYLD